MFLYYNLPSKLGENGFVGEKKILLAVKLIIYALYIKVTVRKKFFNLNLYFRSRRLNIEIQDLIELHLVYDIFLGGEYDMNLSNANMVLDIGSNIGISAIYFACMYPNARICAIEPDPTLFERLKRNTVNFKNVELYQCAVGGRNETLRLYRYPGSTLGASIKARKNSGDFFDVSSYDLDTLMAKLKIKKVIDILKIDAEGSEWDIFSSSNWLASMAPLIVGELHLEFRPGSNIDDFSSILKEYEVNYTTLTLNKMYIFRAVKKV